MRLGRLGWSAVIAASAAAVFVEAGVMSIGGAMEFDDVLEVVGRWPRAVPADWPRVTASLSCASGLISGQWYSGYGPEPAERLKNQTLYRLIEVQIGWPWTVFVFERTFVCEDCRGTIGWMMDDPVSVWEGGLAIPDWALDPDEFMGASCVRRIPIKPHWAGFPAAVGVHGAVLWGLGTLPGAIVRRRRRRCGLCLACGYARAGLAMCPECGRA